MVASAYSCSPSIYIDKELNNCEIGNKFELIQSGFDLSEVLGVGGFRYPMFSSVI